MIWLSDEIIIFSYRVARDLIHNGFIVKDIRPNNKVKDATVVVFDKNIAIDKYLREKWDIGG